MGKHEQIQLFHTHQVRSVWDDEKGVIKEGNESVTNCNQLKLVSPKDCKRHKGLTDEWKRGGVKENEEFALLTDLMSKTWSGMTTKEYKQLKGLKKENLRDNMTNMELLLNAIAEETATQISMERNPEGLKENAIVAKEGADVAKNTRDDIEKRIGHTVISSERALNHTNPKGSLPLNDVEPFTEE